MGGSRTVWFIHQNAYLPEDGPHIRPYAIGKYLTRIGYKVVVFASNILHHTGDVIDTLDEPYIEKVRDGVHFLYLRTHKYEKNDIHRLVNIASFYCSVIKTAEAQAERYGRPDVIYASSLYPTAILAGAKIAEEYGAKLISETRDIVPEGLQAKAIFRNKAVAMICSAMMRRLYKKSDALVFTMSGGPRYIIDRGWTTDSGGFIHRDRLYYVNNGVDLEQTHLDEQRYVLDDSDLDDSSKFCVVYLGAIRFMNQIPLFVEAAKSLKKRGRDDIRILMWGNGTKFDETREELLRLGLHNIVLKGRVDKKYIPGIAKRADLFILTANFSSVSEYGASPNKLFDYLAAGKPVVVPATLADSLIESNGAGIELDNPTGERLADAIVGFADMDKNRYYSYCDNSRTLSQIFDYALLAEKIDRIIREVLSDDRSRFDDGTSGSKGTGYAG